MTALPTAYLPKAMIAQTPLCLAVSQGEIEALYHRFRSLDRGHKVGGHSIARTFE